MYENEIDSSKDSVRCSARECLLQQESEYRARAKAESDRSEAAALANGALIAQRVRLVHEEICEVCQRLLGSQEAV
jgi:hypothetical protein